MANRGKNTNSSQFFVLFGPAPHLDGKHVVFGNVIKGMEILDEIEKIDVDEKNFPLDEIKIKEAKIIKW